MMLKRAQEIYEPEVAQLDDAKRLSAFQVWHYYYVLFCFDLISI